MTKHTISAEELLRAYNGKYKYAVMNKRGYVYLYNQKPHSSQETGFWYNKQDIGCGIGAIAITEFQGKDWTECIYKAKPSEEDWIGKLCWFGNYKEDLDKPSARVLDILVQINGTHPKYKRYETITADWHSCRPVRPDEIKFFNDDTSEE